ncbi:MAG: hypothetical protein LBQ44_10105, partial [Treponema sp.]|nr:hypothetical protein [Treponema sp.]
MMLWHHSVIFGNKPSVEGVREGERKKAEKGLTVQVTGGRFERSVLMRAGTGPRAFGGNTPGAGNVPVRGRR